MNERTLIEAAPPKHNFIIKFGRALAKSLVKVLKLFTQKQFFLNIICTLLISLFIYTGINKLFDLDKFNSEMNRSPFIQDMAGFITYTLPTGELILSLILIVKRTRLLGLYLSFALMALFTGYIWLMLNYAYDLPCSCGGIISKLSWNDHLIFNAVFTGLSMIGIILQSKKPGDIIKKAIFS